MPSRLFKTLAAGLTAGLASLGAQAQTITVGSTNFAEQIILSTMYAEVLKDRGYKVDLRPNLGSREIVYPSIKSGEIDVLPEYSGALLAHVAGGELPKTEEDAVIKALRKRLPEQLTLLKPSEAQNKNTLVVRPETARKYDLETFSDLAEVSNKLIVGGPPEMRNRATGLPGLRKTYGMKFAQFRPLDAGGPVVVGALKNGDVDVARMFTTQGVIAANGWITLKDDKGLSPAQNLVPLVRTEILDETIRKSLNAISAKLDQKTLQELNRQVGVEERDPQKVAKEWIQNSGLLDG